MKAIVLLVIANLLEFGAAIETRYLAFHETGYLPCVHDTNPKVLLVRWFKTTAQDETLVALWSSLEGESINTENYSIDKQNFALIINGTREENEGDFYCYVVYLRSPASTYNVRLELTDEDASLPSTTASRAPFSTQTTEVTSNTTGSEGRPDLIEGLAVGLGVVGGVLVAVAVAVAAGLQLWKIARGECSREPDGWIDSSDNSSLSGEMDPDDSFGRNKRGMRVTDEQLEELCRRIPNSESISLTYHLGIGIWKFKNILVKYQQNHELAVRDILAVWKVRTGGICSDLAAALEAANLRGLISIVYPDGWIDSPGCTSSSAMMDPVDSFGRNKRRMRVTDGQLEKLCGMIPDSESLRFTLCLGINYNEAQSILAQCGQDYKRALMDALLSWRDRTGGSCSDLAAVLEAANLRGLVAVVYPDGWIDTSGKTSSLRMLDPVDGKMAYLLELISLADEAPYTHYSRLCLELGYSYARGQSILTKRLGDYSMAAQDILLDWGTRLTDATESRSILASKLCKIKLVELSERFLGVSQPYTDLEMASEQSTPDTISEDLLKGKVPCNRTRIMFVGPAVVGKTSFIKRLTNQRFDEEEKSTVGTVNTHTTSQWKLETAPRDELAECLARRQNVSSEETKVLETTSRLSLPTTERVSSLGVQDEPSEPNEGIEEVTEYAKGILPERIHNVTSSANDIIYSIWDFGGQEINYITHPLFLSWRSLYIAVFPLHKIMTENALSEEDSSTGQMEGCSTKTYRTMLDLMHFWMMSIYVHAVPPDNMKDPKILLVGTFCNDDQSKSNKEMNISKLLDMVTDKPYGSQVILSVEEVDNKSSSDDEISQIQRKIDDLIKDADYMKEEFPIKWRIFLDQTKDLHEDTLKLTEARKIMSEIGIRDDKEVQDVLKFCHDAGHLIYHQGCELIILHPEVLNSFVSNIITVITPERLHGKEKKDWKLLGKKGVLSMDLIKEVWKQHEGKDDELDMVIDMMIKFDLMCEIQDTQGAYQGRHFFVPCRSSPKFHLEEPFGSDELQFIIDFNYLLPDGFLHRLYVRMAKWAMDQGGPKNPSFHCREMLFYIDERHRVKMSNDIRGDDAHRIMVTIYAISEDLIRNDNSTVKVECTFIEHLEDILDDLKETWARRITYTMGMICTICQKHGETILVPVNKFLSCKGGRVCCDDCSASISVARVQQCIGLRFDGASGEQVSAHCGTVSDSKLNILARHVPHAAYNHLSDGLMVEYNEAQSILNQHCNDFIVAIRECLSMWKNRTGGRLTELKEILYRAEIGGLVKYLE